MPMYLIYRLLSGMAAHPTLSVYEVYFTRDRYFTRTMPHPAGPSLAMQRRSTSLYATAFLAARVLGDAEWPSPTANEIASRLEPDSDGGRPWTASS
jgi:hypothetical protein